MHKQPSFHINPLDISIVALYPHPPDLSIPKSAEKRKLFRARALVTPEKGPIGRVYYAFTEPTNSPDTKYREMNGYRHMMGNTVMTVIAILSVCVLTRREALPPFATAS